MKTLIVSPYPPARDGLASYAVQLAKSLRAEGHRVTVISPQPSGATHSADLRTPRGLLKVLALSRRADRTLVQFHPAYFLAERSRLAMLRQVLGLAFVFRLGRDVRVYVHEADYRAGTRAGRRYALWRFMWRQPARIVVHTPRERNEIIAAFRLDPDRVDVVEHGAGFIRRTQDQQLVARGSLGLPDDAFVFLCIGFIQPHKGFDRAVRGFSRLGRHPHLRLDIVGSVRVSTPEHDAYVDLLHELAAENPAVHLHEGYVNDVLFDRWIQACDAVVLPYRQIWSSSVIERAALFEKPAIITPVGGLPDQARPDTIVVRSESELVTAMAALAKIEVPQPEREPAARESRGDPRALAQRLIDARADTLRSWHEPLAASAVARGARKRVVPALHLPLPPSAMTPKGLVLRAVHRLTRWELWPIVDHANQLRWAILNERVDGNANGANGAAVSEVPEAPTPRRRR